MDLYDMTNGLRVKIVRNVDIYPTGVFRAGLTGTVTDVDDGCEIYCMVKMDRHFPELDEWDNALQVANNNAGICVAEDFEREG